MLSELKLWISKRQLKRKIWKLRVKNPTWYGDIRYNEALAREESDRDVERILGEEDEKSSN